MQKLTMAQQETMKIAQATLLHNGMRRLCVIEGPAAWCYQQADEISRLFHGDWVEISEQAISTVSTRHLSPHQSRTLLGQEFLHGIVDATQGLDVEILAIVSGTLQAGSWLLLLLPSASKRLHQPDADSTRWGDCSKPFATPYFMAHFQRCLQDDADVVTLSYPDDLRCSIQPIHHHWQPPTGAPTAAQNAGLQHLQTTTHQVTVLTAARGRGKSALAGMLLQQTAGTVWVTGPTRNSTITLGRHAEKEIVFYAPDALLALCREHPTALTTHKVSWLLVDEAAAIPSPLLNELVRYFPKVLLTSTLQGYEGTGRGFILKFCAQLPDWKEITLVEPIRWTQGDPLERIVDVILLFQEPEILPYQVGEITFNPLSRTQLVTQPGVLHQFYGLLCSAHYRTSPLDLRRLMDAPHQHFSVAQLQQQIVAALWMTFEGGLDPALAHEIWAGRRRPRGNLVAQSLAAHANQPIAASLRSWRISRIAVHHAWRRHGIARQLIADAVQQVQKQCIEIDYLSVSFGYHTELAKFWQACGFQWVRLGTHKEASSGCYNAMAILPLTPAGKALTQTLIRRFQREWHYLHTQIDLPDLAHFKDTSIDMQLDDDDWRELGGFALAHRPIEAAGGALMRLLQNSSLPLSALRMHLQQRQDIAACVASLNLSGRKALLKRWREESQLALQELDPVRYAQLAVLI